MRETLFRVWHKKEKKMYYPGTFRLKFNRDIKWYTLINPLKAPESPRNIIMMEYSGLKDINEKRIYEADIVRMYPEDKDVYPVIFIEGMFVVKPQKGTLWIDLNIFAPTSKNNEKVIWEVIGNIYENPELLDSEKINHENQKPTI